MSGYGYTGLLDPNERCPASGKLNYDCVRTVCDCFPDEPDRFGIHPERFTVHEPVVHDKDEP